MRKVFLWWHKKKRPLVRGLTSKSSCEGQDNTTVVDVEEENHLDTACSIHTDQKSSALFSAIQRQDVNEVQLLVVEFAPDSLETTCGGLTPLAVSCHLRNLAILKLLLQHNSQVEAEDRHGSTTLHTAICDGWNEGVAELLRYGASPYPRDNCASPSTKNVTDTPLRAAVRTGNVVALQLIFEHYPDIIVRNSEEGSLLHLAAYFHQPEMVKFLLKNKMSAEMLKSCNQKSSNVIHEVLQKKGKAKYEKPILEILRMFFEAGVDVNSKNKDGETPLFLASRGRLPKCTDLLLSFGADLLAMTESGQSVIHGACLGGCAVTLSLLLKTGQLTHLVTAPDKDGKQPFHCAVRSSSIDCCEILLMNGDRLTHRDAEGNSRCSLLLQYFPSTSTQLLTRLFNSHITYSDDPQYDRNFHVIFDFSDILCTSKSDIQSSLIEDINYFQKDLLQHPLVDSFVHLKWTKVRYPFYSTLMSFFVFIIIHTVYIIGISNKCSNTCMNISNLWAFRVLHLVMYLLILWPEVITIIANPKTYLRHWETLTKVVSLTASAYVVCAHQYSSMNMDTSHENITLSSDNSTEHLDSPTHFHLRREISAISVFFGWIELMMLCGRLPILGSHVLMFARIAKSAIKFIAAFIGLLIGFSVSFMVLFSDKDEFRTFGTSFVKTLMMMIGEVDYTDLVDQNTAIISYLILVVFLFLVCILMANLLIGLAVDDINSLQRIGNNERRSKQAAHIITFEKAIAVAKTFRLLPHRLIVAVIKLYAIESRKRIYVNKNRRRFLFYQNNSIPLGIIKKALSSHTPTDDSLALSEKEMYEVNSKLFLEKLEDLKKMITENTVNVALVHQPNNSQTSNV